MSRRNFLVIFAVAMVSFACYQVTDHNPYGRYLSDIINKIDRMYYKPVPREKLFDSAVTGMLQELDEHSEFFGPEEARGFLSLIDQRYGGVGIVVDPSSKPLTVMSTMVGSPAYKADILTGDQLLKIDGKSIAGLNSERVTDKIRGPIGTTVRLTLQRASKPAPFDIALERAEIKVDSVLGDTRNADDSWNFHLEGHPEIGYIRIRTFGDHTVEELKAALATLDPVKLKGLIVDLRFNGGGRLDAAVDVCGEFIPSGKTVVTTRGRDGRIQTDDRSTGPGTYTGFPMVVLVNSMSASASEIVAACLQDYHRAAIAGQRSYGKGTVQKVLPVEGNQGVLKLTTATYWRPSNKNIHRDKDAKETDEWGVMPDEGLAVPLSKEQTATMITKRTERDVVHRAQPHAAGAYVDPQLQRAIEYLEKHETVAAKD
ncbi:MAG TPA: S41 family peptidase [Pirellulales bacterium]|nr:S41 family peptidase [Pirellulales bacterium]